MPSVMRVEAGKEPPWLHRVLVRTVAVPPGTIDDWERRQGEMRLVLQFRDGEDHVGSRDPRGLRPDSVLASRGETSVGPSSRGAFGAGLPIVPPTRWPQAEFLSLVAIAQHYGVKTRLLDWSWKLRVAAYIAARDVKMHGFTGKLAVWALWTDALDLLWTKQVEDPDVELVRAPQAPNPNLAAQAGLFTVARHVHENIGLESVLGPKLLEGEGTLVGALRKYTLPASEAQGLMARLAWEGVHAATVFPGYAGVVEAQAEAEWWARAPR